jgi:hypothetical protein
MRVFLNSILSTIGAESLTDLEFATVTSTDQLYDQLTYDDLMRVLVSRGAVSDQSVRLTAYYVALGANFTPAQTGRSNILIGIPLL